MANTGVSVSGAEMGQKWVTTPSQAGQVVLDAVHSRAVVGRVGQRGAAGVAAGALVRIGEELEVAGVVGQHRIDVDLIGLFGRLGAAYDQGQQQGGYWGLTCHGGSPSFKDQSLSSCRMVCSQAPSVAGFQRGLEPAVYSA